ncbi:anthranilate synthase component II [Desulfonauticus submarinus]
MILLIDNYDSFTFNLVQVLQVLGEDPVVLRNDDKSLFELIKKAKKILISPGPSKPENAGYCLDLLRFVDKKIPVLGVCLGHQILGYFAGAKVKPARNILHGKTSPIYFKKEEKLFNGIPSPATMTRYHSLLVYPQQVQLLEVIAWTKEQEVMGLKYTDRPWYGVQFHPESILSEDGPKVLENFLNL